jgi:hypothetical protein
MIGFVCKHPFSFSDIQSELDMTFSGISYRLRLGYRSICPHCGLVIGEGYSWMGSESAGNDHWDGAIDNMERVLEGDRW